MSRLVTMANPEGSTRIKPIQNDEEQLEVVEENQLHVYYCLCTSMAVISDVTLETLPQRTSDKARLLDSTQRQYKSTLIEGPKLHIRRPGGVEIQQRLKCKNCGLPVAYTCNDDPQRLYVLDGALLLKGEGSKLQSSAAAPPSKSKMKRTTESSDRYDSTSIATTTEQEEEDLELMQADKAYEEDAKAIHRVLGRQLNKKPKTTAPTATKKRGTLLHD
eukprot:m.118802 g.118802  ORF g.118802 m.118802 type:complete len:218 (-) comp15575_c1_seq7:173-826(-)